MGTTAQWRNWHLELISWNVQVIPWDRECWARSTVGADEPIKQRQKCNVTVLIIIFCGCVFVFQFKQTLKVCRGIVDLVHQCTWIPQLSTVGSLWKGSITLILATSLWRTSTPQSHGNIHSIYNKIVYALALHTTGRSLYAKQTPTNKNRTVLVRGLNFRGKMHTMFSRSLSSSKTFIAWKSRVLKGRSPIRCKLFQILRGSVIWRFINQGIAWSD